jgi:hypothetical protein
VTWDDALEPSASNGVTTLVMGNCGVGFAPVRPYDHAALIDLMEGVEDIPGSALSTGMPCGSGRPSRSTWTCSIAATVHSLAWGGDDQPGNQPASCATGSRL